jgi:hypothetical protein
MFIPDPGSRILIFTHPGSRISDLGSRIQKQQQKREVKKFDVIPFNVATNFNKIVQYFSFEEVKKKIWANFQRIMDLFTQKIVPRSGIRKKPIPVPGSQIQGSKRHRIPDPDPQQ